VQRHLIICTKTTVTTGYKRKWHRVEKPSKNEKDRPPAVKAGRVSAGYLMSGQARFNASVIQGAIPYADPGKSPVREHRSCAYVIYFRLLCQGRKCGIHLGTFAQNSSYSSP
jgi:hypothetical protein